MQKPFFSIITRTMPGRENLLVRCVESVKQQKFDCAYAPQPVPTVEHLILRDEIGVGVAEAQKMMWTCSPRGEYVVVLDDDDFLSAPDVLQRLHIVLAVKRPLVAIIKVAHGALGEMPRVWGDGAVLQEGDITVSNVLVEHVQWYLHRGAFGARYAGDFDFIASLFAAHNPLWIDVNVVTVEMMRNGALV